MKGRTLKLSTLAEIINRDFGKKGYKAELLPGRENKKGRMGKKLVIKHTGKVVFEHDGSIPSRRNEVAVRWCDKQLGTNLMADIKERRKSNGYSRKRAKRDILISLMDDRGLKVRVKTRDGSEMTFENILGVDVER